MVEWVGCALASPICHDYRWQNTPRQFKEEGEEDEEVNWRCERGMRKRNEE